MHVEHITTPFGRRPMTLALLRRQSSASEIKRGKTANKWKIFRDISEARAVLELQDRSLAVLDALLSFYPEGDLKGDGQLVVFPSNAQLSLRAHGIAGATLRRHLSSLVEAGLIARRDSPNGKRYARRGRGGDIEEAYGFDLAPLLARAEEFASMAARVVADRIALRRAREHLTICRRDIRKLIGLAVQEGVEGDWEALQELCTSLLGQLPRSASTEDVNRVLKALGALQSKLINTLNSHQNPDDLSTDDAHSEHHIQSSNTESQIESETHEPVNRPTLAKALTTPGEPLPLAMVLRACPTIISYGPTGAIHNWSDLRSAATVVRSMLGVPVSAFDDACQAMGTENASITVAGILERSDVITSAGGYLRDLTRRAKRGQFSTGPMLMALLRAQMGGNRPDRILRA
ncbi:replication initiation protein RepC [Rhizobium cauense]|uniref:plasmid replication protein RepC n=1 Tax=Rhizobium cauense TaxID=1166683 RepID=UPI001C6EE109|nr:plasmid replication protein RepC [Rhizobium cauense]MBW9117346.1 replication initiation protein RepC [Rhizobium cauense]